MDKPEEKPGAQGPLRPPHPPPGGKKPGAPIPKGPVPPRGGMQLPGVQPMNKPPAPAALPPKPPMSAPKPGAPMPPVPGMKPPMPPGAPAMPPAAGAPPANPGLPPAISGKLAEADSAKVEMEQKVAELEKKLLEEREKVLLASLRSKEEEAVSAKVETSIKEIQDKLRRERREQELDETRRKAEARALDLERRMAEEREAWVSTLKTQLSQRDTITQEMEVHFSARLKDLEYRWAQEKSGLESALRDREAELARIRHEFQLKNEQEKSFWEDRLKSISAERDKYDRDLERLKDKASQEKDLMSAERQSLRDQLAKAEGMLKFIDDQHRVEKSVIARESEAQLQLIKHQSSLEKETYEKQISHLNTQVQNHAREISERSTHTASLEQQSSVLRTQLAQTEFRLAEKEKIAEEYRRRATEVDGRTDAVRKKYEQEIDELTRQLNQARTTGPEEVRKVQNGADARIKTLQARLDWYDSNVKREYDNARLAVAEEVAKLEERVRQAEKDLMDAGEKIARGEAAEQEKSRVQQELEQFKADWKQMQWDMEAQVKSLNDQLKSAQDKLSQTEDNRINLEQELRQRSSNATYTQGQLEQRELEVRKLTDRIDGLLKDLELSKEKAVMLEQQTVDYKKILQGKGLQTLDEVQAQLNEKSAALEKMKETLQASMAQVREDEKKDEMFRDKERVFKQILADKDDMMSEFKKRIAAGDRKLEQLQSDMEQLREKMKQEKETLQAQQAMSAEQIRKEAEQLRKEKETLLSQKNSEIEQLKRAAAAEMEKAKRAAADDMAAKIRAELPPPGPSADMIEHQVRQDIEAEFMDKVREKENEMETKLAQTKEETKKELDRLKWEADSMKEELRRAREARSQIEREAQELLTQAEDHYRRELEKNLQQSGVQPGTPVKAKGLFTAIGMTIGRILDTPIIDTKKKKDDSTPPA